MIQTDILENEFSNVPQENSTVEHDVGMKEWCAEYNIFGATMEVCHDMPFEPVTNNDTKEIFCNHCLIDIQEEMIVGGTGVNLSTEVWINFSLGNLLNAIFIDQLKLCHKGLVMSNQSKRVVNKTLPRVTEVLVVSTMLPSRVELKTV